MAGPTASGKSALALELAQRWNGVVINADSMQIYRELRLLTARPSPADEASVPHLLYGVRPAADPANAAWWRTQALATMQTVREAGKLPILCGGTGLYFATLRGLLSDIPDPGEEARTEARALLAANGPAWLHARLTARDPASAAKIRPNDSQRIARAWEVLTGTGQGIAFWQQKPGEGCGWNFASILLDPPRETLRAAAKHRFHSMIAQGALQEVADFTALAIPEAAPLSRALGLAELSAHLRGELTLPAAIEQAVTATIRYTKRQATWFRHHQLADVGHAHIIHAQFTGLAQLSESLDPYFSNFLL